MLLALLCACRAGFDELPPPPELHGPDLDVVRWSSPDSVLWYELDGVAADRTILDISGNELHGICRTTCPAIVEGYAEHALDFSSLTIIDVPKLDRLGLDAFTLSAWIPAAREFTAAVPGALDLVDVAGLRLAHRAAVHDRHPTRALQAYDTDCHADLGPPRGGVGRHDEVD